MKYRVFILTYLSYAMIQACRMSLAYNKPNIRDSFGLTATHLGLMDAAIYISYGVGSFFRFYLFGQMKFAKLYLVSAIFISCFLAALPFIGIFAGDKLAEHVANNRSIIWLDIGLAISMAGYGFSHLAVWQLILSLMSQHWHSKKQGSYIGLWITMSCIGNIIASLVCNLMINQLKYRWETTILIFSILNLLTALIMYFIFQQTQQQTAQSNNQKSDHEVQKLPQQRQQEQIQQGITTLQCIQFNRRKFIRSWDYRLFILSSSCFKILNYSFLFWYPTYLYVQGFEKVSGYVMIVFQVSSIFGSYIVGKLVMYDKVTCRRFGVDQSQDNMFLKVMTVLLKLRNVIMMMFSASMVYLFLKHFGELNANILITILLGLTIGGIFHVNAAYNTMTLGEHIPRKVDMVSSFSTALGTVFLGFFQLVIGLVVSIKVPPHATQKQIKLQKSWSYRKFFYLLIMLMILASILMLFRSKVLMMLFETKRSVMKRRNSLTKQQVVIEQKNQLRS